MHAEKGTLDNYLTYLFLHSLYIIHFEALFNAKGDDYYDDLNAFNDNSKNSDKEIMKKLRNVHCRFKSKAQYRLWL